MAFDFVYNPDGAVLKSFLKDNSFVRLLRGNVGSGKSVACAVDIFIRATRQAPGQDGIRRSRWAVVRNTNPQLKTTTIKTWLDWFPEGIFGKFNWSSPYTHMLRFGDVELEVIFLALDVPADVRKLLSLELTGVWINEARELPKAILDGCTQRVGRYPSLRDGGCTWSGITADTNPPEDDHWWPIMAGDTPAPDWMNEAERASLVRPEGWRFFSQPPAMLEVFDKKDKAKLAGYTDNPARENGAYLPASYYQRMIAGKTRAWIDVYVMGRYGIITEGRPVYGTFNEAIHVASEQLAPVPGHVVYVGIDFGLTPAATFGQLVNGRHFLQRELIATNMGILRFIPMLKELMAREYPGYSFVFTGDPAGDFRAQTDESTPFDILNAAGIPAKPASSNDPIIRQGAVETALGSLVNGLPGYVVSACCRVMKAGFLGGYHIKDGHSTPAKDSYSHPHDAEQYRMMGTGAGRQLVQSAEGAMRPWVARSGFSPRVHSLGRGAGKRRLF